MQQLKLSTELNSGSTSVSNIFIDKYLPQAGGEFVKIYLYLLRCVNNHFGELSVSSLADTFNQTEADVIRALRYWDKMGIVCLSFDGSGKELTNIKFCDIDHMNTDNQINKNCNSGTQALPTESVNSDDNTISKVTSNHAEVNDSSAANDVVDNTIANVTPIAVRQETIIEAKPIYSAAQIKQMSSQEDLKMLLYVASTYLGKTLSSTDASTIIYFYDTLHFPTDLIEYLIEYCVERNHKSMRYIEKVALDWAESGINTIKAAKEESINHNETTYSVMNAFGLSNRNPGQHEKELISKWTDVYCFSSDMIIEACNRTIKATHQPSFEYADTILSRWRDANVQSTTDILKADAEYELNKSSKKTGSSVVSNSSNRFNNFQQRSSDNDDLESSLLSNNG